MKTRRSLKPTDALLVGRLYAYRQARSRSPGRIGRPALGIKVWCPFCKTTHVHGFEDPPFRMDAVSHRAAHCISPGSPLKRAGYFVGLDPASKVHNLEVAREHGEQMAEYAELVGGLDTLTTEELFSTARV
jgi:hypothetical protein